MKDECGMLADCVERECDRKKKKSKSHTQAQNTVLTLKFIICGQMDSYLFM